LFDGGARVPAGPVIVECLMAGRLLGIRAMPRRQLLETYRHVAGELADADSFDRGLRWARAELHGEVALIVGGDDALSVYSHAAANAEPFGDYRGRAERALAARVDVDELLGLADQAGDRRDFERSLRLVELALERTDDERRQAVMIFRAGDMQHELERFEQAQATFERALAIEERVYGPEHHAVAITLTNLGNVQRKLGQLEQAEDAVRRARHLQGQAPGGPSSHEVGAACACRPRRLV
jgi:tetratricopeptide (TPR) repeat protein